MTSDLVFGAAFRNEKVQSNYDGPKLGRYTPSTRHKIASTDRCVGYSFCPDCRVCSLHSPGKKGPNHLLFEPELLRNLRCPVARKGTKE